MKHDPRSSLAVATLAALLPLGLACAPGAAASADGTAGADASPLATHRRLEVQANTFTYNLQNDAGLAIDDDGRVLVVWASRRQELSSWGVFAQLLDPLGRPLGTELHVNEYVPKNQRQPYPAFGPDGDAWVVWASLDPGTSRNGIFARRFAGEGAGFGPVGPDLEVAALPWGALEDPAVAVGEDGELLVTWVTYELGARHVEARRLGADGTPAGPAFRLGEEQDVLEALPELTALPGGAWFVAWQRTDAEGQPLGILGRRVEGDGTLGPVRALSEDDGRHHVEPSLDADARGRIVLAWMAGTDGGYEVRARRFDARGLPLGESLRVDQEARGQRSGAAAVCAPDGRFLVAYNDVTAKLPRQAKRPVQQADVRARFFDPQGRPLGEEQQWNAAGVGPHALRVGVNGRAGAWSGLDQVALAWAGTAAGDEDGIVLGLLAPPGLEPPAPPAVEPLAACADLTSEELRRQMAPPDPLPEHLRDLARVPSRSGRAGGFVVHDQTGWEPPDPDLAVGPNHVVSQVNQEIAWFTKAGVEQHRQDNTGPSGFWGAQGAQDFVFDPVSVYDRHLGRFVVANAERASGESYLVLAVSKTSDPNDGWWKYRHRTETLCSSIDFENLGVDAHAIYVSADCFGFGGNNVFVYDKAIVGNGLPLASPKVINTEAFPISLGSVNNYDASSPAQYFVTSYTVSNDVIEIKAIRNALGAHTLHSVLVPVTPYFQPSDAPQLGSSNPVSTIDWRIKNAVVRDGHLYASHGIDDGSGVTRVRWYEVDLQGWPTGGGLPQLVQEGTLDLGPGVYSWFPDVGVDPAGNVTLVFSRSAASELPSMHYVLHLAGDPPGSNRPSVALQTSTQPYGGGRWGDYNGVDEDPARPGHFWGHAEYSEGPWMTWAGSWATIEATATVRSGSGVNDACYSSTETPVIGQTWDALVTDAFHPGATFSAVLGYGLPLAPPVPTALGELLVDPSTGPLVTSLKPMVAGQAVHSFAVPDVPSLFGSQLFTQAATGGAGLHLCNGIDLLLAY